MFGTGRELYGLRFIWAETILEVASLVVEIIVLLTLVSLCYLLKVLHFICGLHSTGDNPLVVALPSALPSGDYLVRGEHLALHIANQPQFYIGCGQVTITNGGTGTPGPLVEFPGAYVQGDKAIWNNFNYPKPVDYTPPGPAVWIG